MQRVRILAPITLAAGTVLALSGDQWHDRRHALVACGAGVYEAIAPISFKAGQEIGCASPLPKALAALIENAAAPETKQKRKSK